MSPLLRLGALVLVAFAFPAQGAKRKPVDLSSFHGVYRGTVSITLSGKAYRGAARIKMLAGKKGRSATMLISGEFIANGRSFPIRNRLVFLSSRIFSERSITHGFTGSSVSVTGRYAAHKHRLSFEAPFIVNHTSGKALGDVTIRQGRHRRQTLALRTSIILDGQPANYLFDFQTWRYFAP